MNGTISFTGGAVGVVGFGFCVFVTLKIKCYNDFISGYRYKNFVSEVYSSFCIKLKFALQ